ncbi:MAG: NAD(P)-binding domain-containing protein [Chitinophagales bacterium]|nr:NAD(P)-binding domain-containing protein [Chitinophagales bacterium]
MNIAIIGTGNVGGALATQWSKKGHNIYLGVQDTNKFKGVELLKNEHTSVSSIGEAVKKSDTILIATPPTAIFDIIELMGDVSGKVIIDATNAIMKRPEPFATVYHCLAEQTDAKIVKCFNSTGFENMLNPKYGDDAIDMFMAGDSDKAKSVAKELALDCGFGTCIDFGKSDKVDLLEKFALSWINLAIMQGHGRNLAFKVMRR